MKLVDIKDEHREEYEKLLPKETLELFKWAGNCYMFCQEVPRDKAHWVSEINFGLRMFQKGKGC